MKSVDPESHKELLPLGGKPAIHWTVEAALAAGMARVVVVISSRKEAIRKSLGDFPADRVLFAYQEEPKGEMEALLRAEAVLGEGALAVHYPDNLSLPPPGGMGVLIDAYRRTGLTVVGLTPVGPEMTGLYGDSGRVRLTRRSDGLYRVAALEPKGRGAFVPRFPGELRGVGLAVYPPGLAALAAALAPEAAAAGMELTDGAVFARRLTEGRLLGAQLPGQVHDVGRPEGYRHAVKLLADRES